MEDVSRYREYLEDLLINNRVKLLVATIALGMGFDKPDIGFVVHFQVGVKTDQYKSLLSRQRYRTDWSHTAVQANSAFRPSVRYCVCDV